MLAALEFGPFPLYLAQSEEPELRNVPLVIAEEQHVIHANSAAKRHGVIPGMRLVGAHMRVANLEVRSFPEPDVEHAWHALLRELHDYTPWLESGARGRVFLRSDREEVTELVRRYGIRGGIAPDIETAELSALAANPGSVREVVGAKVERFLTRLPLRFLRGVGVSEANLTRLHWLGLTTAADLARWSARQLRTYLGEEGQIVIPYLHGPRRTTLHSFSLPASVRRTFTFREPVREPQQIVPAIERLATELEHALAGRAARRLTLTATLGNTQRRASRLAKRPLQQARHIRQQALFALQDSHAGGRAVERITVELSAPERSGLQEGLWPQRERREQALEDTLERFPAAPRRLVWRDQYAQAADLAWAWERYTDEREPRADAQAVERRTAVKARAASPAHGIRPPAVTAAEVPLFLEPIEFPSDAAAPQAVANRDPVPGPAADAPAPVAMGGEKRRNRSAFVSTKMLENPMAAAASMGERSTPRLG
jgi:nucleotidyltransferase/DNA polymerase involved in DNA repair